MRMGYWLAACVVGATGVVMAAELPARKPGLWEINMAPSDPKMPGRVEKVCLDKATDQLLYKVGAGASQKLCSKVDMHSSGGKVIVDSECHIGGSTATSHSVTTFVGDSAYHTDVTVHYVPAIFGKSDSTTTHEAKWVGACPPDMRPGDVIMTSSRLPEPIKMNLNDMFNSTP